MIRDDDIIYKTIIYLFHHHSNMGNMRCNSQLFSIHNEFYTYTEAKTMIKK